MQPRTDLAIEANGIDDNTDSGIVVDERRLSDIKVTKIDIKTDSAAERLHKPIGRYITVEGLRLRESFRDVREHIEAVANEIRSLLPEKGLILVSGLGNRGITPDALGPESMEHILATRHITGELARSTGLDGMRPVAVLSPGVLGQTGIETAEMISGICAKLNPCGVIVVDALAAREAQRLGTTIQICNTGISPGSGVGNHRMKLNRENLGVPVISVGVPTVVDAATLAYELLRKNSLCNDLENDTDVPIKGGMMVTPGDIDLLTQRASKLVGMSINCALQSNYDFDALASLVS